MATKKRSTKTTEARKAQTAARWKMIAETADWMEGLMEMDGDVRDAVEAVAAASGYSERNASLIVGQCQGATEAHSFRAWTERGRVVRKGEKALYILAPTKRTKARGEKAETTDDGQPLVAEGHEATGESADEVDQGEKGEDGKRDGEKMRRRFVLVPVFDRSQTEPAEPADEATDAAA